MATLRLPRNFDPLITMAEGMANGLKIQETHVGLKQNTEAEVRTDIAAATGARDNYRKAVLDNADLTAVQTAADSAAKAFIGQTKDLLGHFLGKQWSPAWQLAGFLNHSLAVPTSAAKRQPLLKSIQVYLEANPEKQNTPLNITSVRAGDLSTALENAVAAVSNSNGLVSSAKAARDGAEQTLRNRISGLIAELRQLLDDDDPVWYAFGLNRPADPETPGVPENLMLTAGQPGSIYVTWAPSRRAVRYRVYQKEEGETDYQAAVTSTDPHATISGLRSGSVQIQVSAANGAGESKPCAPAQITVPAAPAIQART